MTMKKAEVRLHASNMNTMICLLLTVATTWFLHPTSAVTKTASAFVGPQESRRHPHLDCHRHHHNHQHHRQQWRVSRRRSAQFNQLLLSGNDDINVVYHYDDEYLNLPSSSSSSSSSSSTSWSITDNWEAMSRGEKITTVVGGGGGGGGGDDDGTTSNSVFGTLHTVQVAASLDAAAAAVRSNQQHQQQQRNEDERGEEKWIQDVVDEIQLGDLQADLYDTADTSTARATVKKGSTSIKKNTKNNDEDDRMAKMTEVDMGDEIAMLVRCNESPQNMLIAEGRALPSLTDEEKYDVMQLVDFTPSSATSVSAATTTTGTKSTCQATNFLRRAVSYMFHRHAKPHPLDGVMAMTSSEVAAWMTCALSQSEQDKQFGKVSPHDSRVLKTLSDYSSYGSGRLVEEDLQELYLTTLVGDFRSSRSLSKNQQEIQEETSPKRYMELFRQPHVEAVWRDILAHGLLPPVEEEWLAKDAEMNVRSIAKPINGHQISTNGAVYGGKKSYMMMNTLDPIETIMDECEILDWDYRASEASTGAVSNNHKDNDQSSSGSSSSTTTSSSTSTSKRQSTRGASSHKLVELACDNKTPLYMRDGDFVFIDEESCIGCYNCANIAPAAFQMLESGRARTFHQRKGADVHQAILSCPVSCMHSVSFRELQQFETARDEGDGRTDHRHLGHKRGHTPLHVAGIASDNNHRSSWYHTLKHKCLMSADCPQKGCYDCPKYSTPGENPFFKAKHKQAEHVRAQHFLDHGDVDHLRQIADL